MHQCFFLAASNCYVDVNFQTDLSANTRPCASGGWSLSHVDIKGEVSPDAKLFFRVADPVSPSPRQALRPLPLRPCVSLTMKDITAGDLPLGSRRFQPSGCASHSRVRHSGTVQSRRPGFVACSKNGFHPFFTPVPPPFLQGLYWALDLPCLIEHSPNCDFAKRYTAIKM